MKPATTHYGVLIIALLLFAATTGHAFNGADPFENLLLFGDDGDIIGTYHLGHYTGSASRAGADFQVQTFTYNNGPDQPPTITTEIVPAGEASSAVPNALSGAYPLPPSGAPQVSLFSFDAATLTGNEIPGLSYSPSSGTYTKTIAVQVRAYPTNATLSYRQPGALSWTTSDDNEMTLYVYQDTTLEFCAVHEGYHSPIHTLSYTISRAGDPHPEMVDSDGDGYPDGWEIMHGLDPLDANLDSDRDGMSDADEILRGSDPYSNTSLPLDDDGDGWSNFDEEMRHTDPDEAASIPAARRLYEVERCISGVFYRDSAATTPVADHPFFLRSFSSGPLPLGSNDCSVPPQAPTAPGEELPTTLETDGAGHFGPHRIPVGEPGLIRLQGSPSTPMENLVVKRYLPVSDDLTPRGLMQGESWTSAAQWQSRYLERLGERLLEVDNTVNIVPDDAFSMALFERELELVEGYPSGIFILLGSSTHAAKPATLQYMEKLIGTKGLDLMEFPPNVTTQNMNAHFADLKSLLQRADEETGLVSSAKAIFLALSPGDADDAEVQLATLYQGTLGRYLAGLALLYTYNSLELLVSGSNWAILLDPDQDLDGDGVDNGQEVLRSIGLPTSPFTADSDGDTIPDSSDNCPAIHNPGQSDFDSDGLGDSCDPDDDNDGLSDGLELAFGSNPYDTDTDNDGESDWEEWEKGENPGILVTITVDSPTLADSQTVGGLRADNGAISLTTDTAAIVGPVDYPAVDRWQADISGLVYGDNNISVLANGGSGSTHATIFRAKQYLPGDINADGTIDLVDVVLLLQILTDSPLPPDEDVDPRGDIGIDGRLGPEELLFNLNTLLEQTP